jgi:hypothetical protein
MPKQLPPPHVTDTDFRYCVNVKYDTDRSNCTCGQICRCERIINPHIRSVCVKQMVRQVLPSLSKIDQYCVDRILTCYKVWDPNNWKVRVEQGYYGDEICGAFIVSDLAAEIDKKLTEILTLDSTTKKIEALLLLEYGYLLPQLKGCEYHISTLKKNDIEIPQETYSRRLERNVVANYADYNLPRGVVLLRNNRHRLIDGYHRMAALDSYKTDVIVATHSFGNVQLSEPEYREALKKLLQ